MKKRTINSGNSKLLDDLLAASRRDRVLLKREGKPVALLINVEDKDEEQIETENDPEFWRMIETSRHQQTTPWDEAKAKLAEPHKSVKTTKKSRS